MYLSACLFSPISCLFPVGTCLTVLKSIRLFPLIERNNGKYNALTQWGALQKGMAYETGGCIDGGNFGCSGDTCGDGTL